MSSVCLELDDRLYIYILGTKDFICFLFFRQQMESQLGSIILATDISRQNEYLSQFRTHLDKGDLCLDNAGHRHFILQVFSFVQYVHLKVPFMVLFKNAHICSQGHLRSVFTDQILSLWIVLKAGIGSFCYCRQIITSYYFNHFHTAWIPALLSYM